MNKILEYNRYHYPSTKKHCVYETSYLHNFKSLCLYSCTGLDIPVMKDLKIFAQIQ